MGCASSTPMVATAGSEILKAATHVAGDVKQKGEEVVEDASQALSAGLDTAKETVSTAVAGVTSELGNAFKDGTSALDEAKHKVMEGLHLETKPDVDAEAEGEGEGESPSAPSSSRAPTPALDADADSLKTSTPEPEIERALANEEEAPPTPKPSLQELAQLSAQVADSNVGLSDAVAAAATEAATAAATTTVDKRSKKRKEKQKEKEKKPANVEKEEEEQRRPSTTEWEKLADQLAKSRKFRPYESFAHTKNQFSVYKDYTSLRDKPGHYDGHFSDGNSLSSASQSQSDLSSGHLTPAPPTRRGQRDYAKFVGAEQAASVSRASSRLSTNVRTFDFNPQRERISLPGSRVGSRVGSARRSLWAREQPVLAEEEPPTQPRVRRSSMVGGVVGQRSQLPARSSSNLSSSSLTAKISSQPKELALESSSSLGPHMSLVQVVELSKESSKRAKQVKPPSQLSETFKSMLDSSRDISSALLLATPLTVASMLNTNVAEAAATGHSAPTKSTVMHATPTLHNLTKSTTTTTTTTAAAATTTTTAKSFVPKLPSPSSRVSSRASSGSSNEIVIRPLSHLNTPSAVSLSPDQVVVAAYEDSDLEAALARLSDWRGSTTTLHSLHSVRSSNSRLANSIAQRDSRRTSPWIRRQMEHNAGQELKPYASCGIAELSSPSRRVHHHQLLERCEICCNEFVMKLP